jgi:hypothetical protein
MLKKYKIENMPAGTKIKKQKKMAMRLYTKYGNDFLVQLKDVYEKKPFWSLSKIARNFKLSRERVRQIYNVMYLEGIRDNVNPKKIEQDLTCINDPRSKVTYYKCGSKPFFGAVSEKLFMEECEKRGFEFKVVCESKYDMVVNGYKVEIKSRTRPSLSRGNVWQCGFNLHTGQKEATDIFACYHPIEKSFFIIPKSALEHRVTLSIRACKSNDIRAKNRYWEYQNAWHLLEAPKEQVA